MRIKKLNYINKTFGWELDSIEFDKLTLFVGASGVGKTQILNAILDLKRIANGIPISGVFWNVEFETTTGIYKWIGEFENIGPQFFYAQESDTKRRKPRIISEQIFYNNDEIINRTKEDTYFHVKKH